jgi:hypothetical protein
MEVIDAPGKRNGRAAMVAGEIYMNHQNCCVFAIGKEDSKILI